MKETTLYSSGLITKPKTNKSACWDLYASLVKDDGTYKKVKCISSTGVKSELIAITVLECSSKCEMSGKDIEIWNSMINIPPKSRILLPTGVFTAPISEDIVYFQVTLRSGFAWETGCIVPNAPGIIDQDYTGEWFINIYNPTDIDVTIRNCDRIAQCLCLKPHRFTHKLNFSSPEGISAFVENNERGDKGFGSTGK